MRIKFFRYISERANDFSGALIEAEGALNDKVAKFERPYSMAFSAEVLRSREAIKPNEEICWDITIISFFT